MKSFETYLDVETPPWGSGNVLADAIGGAGSAADGLVEGAKHTNPSKGKGNGKGKEK